VASLSLNGQLDAAAQAKANDMATRNYWSHYTPDGNPPWVFVSAQGYAYQKLGENLATGFNDEQATINGWMASPPHRENLLDPAFSDVGFGFANNPNYTAAGGGPMTIIVAFYGRTVAAPVHAAVPSPASSTTPSAPSAAPPSVPSAPVPTVPVTDSTPPPAAPTSASAKKGPAKKAATTETSKSGITLSLRTTGAQVAFARVPAFTFAGGMALFALLATLLLWFSRHALFVKKAWATSEAYAIKHPLVDVGFLVVTALLFLLNQTVGFIQ
jgi:hypothetical protein